MLEEQLSDIAMHFDGMLPNRFEKRNRSLRTLASSRDLICTHDLAGHILYANRAACDAVGLGLAEIQTMSIQDLMPREGDAGFNEYMQTLLREGSAAGLMRIVPPAGGPRIWEYHNSLETPKGSATIVRGVARDVTDREEAFLQVRRSEDYFRSIIEHASDIIVVVGSDGHIRYGSPSVERVLGYPRRILAGISSLHLIHPDDAQRGAAFLARQIAEPAASQTIELRARHRDDSWRSFEMVATNLVRKGQTSAVIINARDITERKLLEAQLLQANRLGGLGRLAATVAHEFNNVLMGMQPFAELMQRPEATPEIISRGAGHISNSIQRGRRIVLDILRFSQPHVPVTAAVDVGEWWEGFAPEAEAVLGNSVEVVSTIPKRGLHIVADRSQLSQVLANLVANARDAMPRGGTLTVSANGLDADAKFRFGVVPYPERFVQISVRDTGQGMTHDVIDRIFEPLFTTRASGGTGLGLAVAHQVITQHAGHIFVESEAGRGSTFHLFLPKCAAPAIDHDAPVPARKPAAQKLLIIDDESSISEGIAALLEQDGIDVQSITSGLQATQAIVRFHPDVVVLDLGLPDMDGREVYARIRELEPLLPIIFATGHGDRRILHDRLNDPHTRFLQKPFEIASLIEMIVDLETEGVP